MSNATRLAATDAEAVAKLYAAIQPLMYSKELDNNIVHKLGLDGPCEDMHQRALAIGYLLRIIRYSAFSVFYMLPELPDEDDESETMSCGRCGKCHAQCANSSDVSDKPF